VSEPSRIVIAGGGLAGAKAAEGLREEGYEGAIVLLGAEPDPPYERPPLSKGFLQGEQPRDEALVHPRDYYERAGVELRTGTTVDSIDVDAREVALADGERIGFDRLLIATGARSRKLPIAGADLAGIHTLRDLGDSERLAAALSGGARLAIVGGGWIGAEVAASARTLGAEVDLIERGPVVLGAVLGEELGGMFEGLHREHGVRIHANAAVAGFAGADRVEAIRLESGEEIACDVALVAVGAVPAVELAEAAGLAVEDGIVVDEALETSAPGIFAAGDVANAWRPFYGRRFRIEHWANALEQGGRAARTMLGRPAGEEALPYFFTDQYDLGMEYTGLADGTDELVVRGDVEARELIAFWLREGRVVAGMNVNVWDVNEEIAALIRSGARVDPDRLREDSAPLAALAG
jgi:3-phenylpropionate/trans-cinnamate dioxygenase ferredoxin reductase subunit